ncbi:MAG: hypothetical protein IJW38_02525 [Clostridia bacterium]|nr:hypothetical protein [Clostridia bacterium]
MSITMAQIRRRNLVRASYDARDSSAYSINTKTNTSQYKTSVQTPSVNHETQEKNKNGFWGGIGYTAEKLGLGFLSTFEGLIDYAAGGIAKLLGDDKAAEDIFNNDWVNYNHADEWYNPDEGWKLAGDVFGGIGTSLAGITAGAVTALATGGAGAGIAASLVAGGGAAGNATKEAYRETGKLDGKAFQYGALSGVTEGVLEAITGGLGAGSARIAKSIGSSLARKSGKELAEATVKSTAKKALLTMGKDFAGEAFEEGMSEILAPLYQRWTYNPEAENASWQEIGYSALVGGLSGVLMGGGQVTINSSANLISGNKSVKNGTDASIIESAKNFSEYNSKFDTGYEVFDSIKESYTELSKSLEATGGKVTTAKQKMLLGNLKRLNTSVTLAGFVERSAEHIAQNPELYAEKFKKYGIKDSNGNEIKFTAEELTQNLDKTGDRKKYIKSLRKAITSDTALAKVAIAEATGNLIMDTRMMADSALQGERIASRADFDYLVEHASQEEIAALTEVFGVEDWGKITVDQFNTKMTELNENGTLKNAAEQMQRVKLAKESETTVQAKTLPHRLSPKLSDGVHHYTSENGANIALMKDGDTYHVYDYSTGNISKPMTMQDVNKALKSHYTSAAVEINSDSKIAAAMPLTEATADLSAETKNAADSTNVESAAETKSKNGESIRNAFRGYAADGKGIYEAAFPQGTPKRAKSEKILDYIQNVWSKEPITLIVSNGDSFRTIQAKFDPTVDSSQNVPTDASKIAGGNRHGNHTEQRVTLDLADDYYQIVSESVYNYSKIETGKTSETHKDVKMWHYFVNDIYFAEYGTETLTPYTVTINVKEKTDGNFVYSFNAEKEPSTRQTLHAGVNTRKGANGELFLDNSIPDSSEKINSFEKNSSEKVSSYEKLKAQNAEIAKFAEENIKDYKKLNDVNRRAVRAVIRQGRAYGLSDADIVTVASVSAHSGAKIKFSKADCKRTNKKGETFYVDGFYDGDTDTITVNPEKMRSTDRLLLHELLHDIVMHLGGSRKGFKIYKKLVKQAFNNMSEEQQTAIVAKYQEMGESRDSVLTEEILAHYGEAFANKSFFEAMLTERQSLGKRILNFFKSAITDYQGDERLTRSARKFQRAFKKLFDDYSAINQNTNAYDSNLRLSEGEKRNAAAVDNYSEEEYNNFGWARENNVLNAAENERLRSLFADAVMGKYFPETDSGEYMIAIGDKVDNKIAYMTGEIDNPVITRILEIDEYSETKLDEIRRDVYETERSGIQRQTEGIFKIHAATDFGSDVTSQRSVSARQRYNNQLGAKRSSGSGKTQRIKEIVFEENGTERITYSDGSVEIRNSQNDIKSDSNKRYALSADFDIAKGSISSKEIESKLKQLKNYAKNMTPSSILATQIQFTNTQAGIEAAGRALGIKEIEAEVQAVRASRNQAQEMLAGQQWSIMGDKYVKEGDGFYKIIEPTQAKGKEYYEDFQQFLFHRHNIDRMSLEERSIAKNEAKKQELAELQTKLKELKAQLAEINAELKDLKLQKGREAVLKRSKLNDTKQGLIAEQNALEKNVDKLRRDIESFKPEENKAVFGKKENGETVAVTADESRIIAEKYLKLHPEFEAEAEKIYTYLDNLQKMRLDAGLIDETLYKALKEKYPHYVPTYRDTTKQGTSGISGKYNLAVKKTIAKAKGSVETLMSLDDSISIMTEQVITAANVNRLGNTLYDAALSKNNTEFIGEVSRKKTSLEDFTSDEDTSATEKTNQISIYRNGEKITLSVTKEVFAGFDAFNPKPDFASAPIKALAGSNKVFKELVTSLNPFFLVRNVIRDFQDAGINTKYFKSFFKNYCRAIYHLSHNTKEAQLYRAMGGLSSSVFESGKGYVAKQSKMGFAVSNNKLKAIFSKMQNLNMFVEQIPRFAEFLSSIEAGNSPRQAILDAADVTTNFGRTGKITKSLNSTIIPFLNPAIQGLSKITRNVKEAFTSVRAFSLFAVKLAIIGVIPQIFNQLMYEDDEEYEELKDTDKENNYLFKVGDTFIKIPKGRVVSVIAGAVNRTSQEIEGEGADWKDYFDNVISQVTPVENFARPVWAPVQDVINNRTWYGSEIEGQQFENVREEDRYDESTSSWAKALGKAFNYSPKKIHYLIDQYSGVIGDFLIPLTTQKAENSLIKGNFTIDPVTSNSLSNDFYKLYEEAQYLKTDGDVTAKYQVKYLNSVKSAVSEMYDEKNKIQQSSLSDAEKLQQTRVIQTLINEAFRNAINGYETYTEAITSTQGLFDEEKEERLRYTEITRLTFGAEKALKVYNSDVYEKCKTLNTAGISYDTLYTYYFATKGITGDTDRRGNTISGSKRKKIVSIINSLNVSREQKLLLIASKGYSLQDGDVRGLSANAAKKCLLSYIIKLRGLTKDEKAALAEACGFTVKNGKILMKSA